MLCSVVEYHRNRPWDILILDNSGMCTGEKCLKVYQLCEQFNFEWREYIFCKEYRRLGLPVPRVSVLIKVGIATVAYYC